MKTKELIEHLELNKLSKGLNKRDEEITDEIIKRLKELEELKRAKEVNDKAYVDYLLEKRQGKV